MAKQNATTKSKRNRNLLSIADIQDEEDIQDRIEQRKHKRLEVDNKPISLNEKVNSMNIKFLSKGKRKKERDVEVDDSKSVICDMILDNFDKLKLYENLNTDSGNLLTKFRLYIYAIKYNQEKYQPLTIEERKLFIKVFNKLSQVKEFDYNHESKFVKGGENVMRSETSEYKRRVEPIKIPKRIMKLLGE